ncbi:MAG: citrate (pro-3S)-lyase subunit beta [Tissierellales bacterium]|nr:citrate (pro-3S)-lyase subunit beta [Tissierellales bacterium]MBN2828518.1 citrate (pro-3S)-lyase subunit beta [Tissierellales bacterium]
MEKLRRTMLYVPGNSPAMVKDIYIYQPDSIMFDLEDSISLSEKDSARFLVSEALKKVDYQGIETVVRVNGLETEFGLEDLEMIVMAQPDVIRLPKTETASDVHEVEAIIERIEQENNIPIGKTKMMAAIETAKGVVNASAIASSSKRLIGIALGAEDYVTNLKTNRSPEGIELLFARCQILNAARAAGIAALDTVYSDVENEEGFRKEVEHIKQLGFDGKSIINPRQIDIVHEIYAPKVKEIEHALKVIAAIKQAEKDNLGVVSLNGKMIDKPIVERAERVLQLSGIYNME